MQQYPKLISLDVCKTALNLTGTSLDEVLDRVIGWVSNAIQRKAGQPIAQADIVVDLDGCNMCWDVSISGAIMLLYYPVSALVTMETFDGTFDATYEEATAGDYQVRKYGSLYYIVGKNGLSKTWQYRATITVGYEDVPGEIQKIALEMVKIHLEEMDYLNKGKGRLGVSTINETSARTNEVKTTALLSKRPEWLDEIMYYAVAETV